MEDFNYQELNYDEMLLINGGGIDWKTASVIGQAIYDFGKEFAAGAQGK